MEGMEKKGARQRRGRVSLFFFLCLALLFRFKLGTIFVLAGLWSWAEERLVQELELPGAAADPGERFLSALYQAFVVGLAVFIVFSLLNIFARTINNDWRWFQLP
jgi:hypothetical protein